jgi:hypothetical protein
MAIYRLTQQGHLLDGEIWNATLHINHLSGDGAALLTTCAEAVTLLWQGPPTPANSIQQLVPTTIGLDEIVLDQLNGIGRNVEQFRTPLSLDGTDASDVLPFQCSVAVSTRTDLPTRAGRGRFFLPPFGLDTAVAGLFDGTAAAQVARAAKAMVDHINAGTTFGCVVYHRASNDGDFITSVDVGNVFDTQRRRRNQITETRVAATIA